MRPLTLRCSARFISALSTPEDEMVENTMRAVEEKLWVKTEIGGIARFENDDYMRVSDVPTTRKCLVYLHALAG